MELPKSNLVTIVIDKNMIIKMLSRRFDKVRNKALPIIAAAMVHWVCATLGCEATRHARHVGHTSTWKPATRCLVNSPVAG